MIPLLIFLCNLSVLNAQVKDSEFRKAQNGTYVIAHRGAHEGIPENSLHAYQKAIDLGCDFVEIDVRTTKDGKFISMHNASVDAYVKNTSGKVKEMTLTELKMLDIGSRTGPEWKDTPIPTLEEILLLCKGKIGIYLDLKETLVPELVDIIRKNGMERDIVWYIPASRMNEIRQLISLCPECIPMPDPGPQDHIDPVVDQVNPEVLATDMDHHSLNFVKKAHVCFSKVFVDEKEGTQSEWEQILKWGTDGIQTDHPEELINFLKKRNRSVCE